MKRIFSRVAHAFKHEDAVVQDEDSRAAESASMTSVDSGVLEDVSPEPPAEQRRASSGLSRSSGEIPPSPVSGQPADVPETITGPAASDAANGRASPDRSLEQIDDTADSSAVGHGTALLNQQDPLSAEPAGRPAESDQSGRAATDGGDLQSGGRVAAQAPPPRQPSHPADLPIRCDKDRGDASAPPGASGPTAHAAVLSAEETAAQAAGNVGAVCGGSRGGCGEGVNLASDEGAVSMMGDGEVLESGAVRGGDAPVAVSGDSAVMGGDSGNGDAAKTERVNTVEKSSTQASLVDSDGMVLETGTEDTADDLDGKPKEKKKKRRKKKNKGGVIASGSLDVMPVAADVAAVSDQPVCGSAPEPAKDGDASSMASVNNTSRAGTPAASAGTPKSESVNTAPAKTASGRKASRTPTAQTTSAKKPAEVSSQRRGGAKAATRASAAKQTTLDNSSRSSTPSRTPENPARTRIKREVQKAVSIESNSSTGSRGSTSSRPSSAVRKASSAASKSAAERKNSLTMSNSSISTTTSNREEVRPQPGGRDQPKKSVADRKASKTGTKKVPETSGAASPSTRSQPSKKASAVQVQSGSTDKKAAGAKDKKSVTGRRKSERPGATAQSDKASKGTAKQDQSKSATASDDAVVKKSTDSDAIKTAVSGKGDSEETVNAVSVSAGDAEGPSVLSSTTQGETAEKSSSRPPLEQQDTIEESPARPPLIEGDTIEESPARPPLVEGDTIEESLTRPPLIQEDTIEESLTRPPLIQEDTIEESLIRPPLIQEDTIDEPSRRPPLTEQETVEETMPLPTLAQQQAHIQSTARANLSEPGAAHADTGAIPTPINELCEAVNVSLVNGMAGHLEDSPKGDAAPPVDTIDAVVAPPSPSAPAISVEKVSEACSGVTGVSTTPERGSTERELQAPATPSSGGPSSRRSSVEVLDEGRAKLRRSHSNQGEPAALHDPVLEVMTQVHADSEARLAARRQARAEAREIRMRELERQQREAELNGEKPDDFSDVPARSTSRTPRGTSATSGRRASEDSAEDGLPGPTLHLRDARYELRELEEKLRKTMVTSAQLDNDKSTLNYQVELLKDRLEELQESHTQLQREHRIRCSDHEQLKRVSNRLKEDLTFCKKLLDERDKLIAENGLVLVGDEEDEEAEKQVVGGQKALVSQAAAELLQKAGAGTLDGRLRRLGEEKNELEDQLRRLKLQLEEERHMSARARISGTGAGADADAVQREVGRQLGEYRFKLQKADQDITNLQTAVQRLENQVARYKSAAETAEKAEEELKGEKRKLQRELRESLTRVDELETTNSHLQKRLDKLKNARSNLLKDLSAE